jgi:hypothetical protein
MVGGADFWTQPLVGRKHFDVRISKMCRSNLTEQAFGTFYTHETRNYYGDTWMSDVYGTTGTTVLFLCLVYITSCPQSSQSIETITRLTTSKRFLRSFL